MIDTASTWYYSATPPIAILGVPFDNLTAAETIDLVERVVAARQSQYLVTANVGFLVQAQEDVELRRVLFDAHLVLCDDAPLVWASRLLGNPLPGRVTGPDLLPLLIRTAVDKGYRLFYLGATPESAGKAVANLIKQHPKLIVAGYYSPSRDKSLEQDHNEIKRRILEARPDLLFVSLNHLQQEKWIAMHYRSLEVPVSVGVGSTFDSPAVRRKRAHNFKETWVFGCKILAQWWQLQFRSRKVERPQISAPVRAEENWQWIKLPERLDLAAVRDDALLVDQVLADGRHCLLEMDNVKFIDSTGVGLLIRLQKKIRATGRQLVLLAPSAIVQRAMELMHLQNFFDLAPDFASAQQLIEKRTREAAATRRTTAALNPLFWQGEITAANANQVWEMTQAYITSPLQQRELVIDLSGVRFLDSNGVSVMIRAKRLAQHQGAKLAFIGPQSAVRNVLHLSQLEEFLLEETSRERRVR